MDELTAVSSIDGRYRKKVAVLEEWFSEYGLLKLRVEVELAYYQALTGEKVSLNFSLSDAGWIKDKEEEIKHDVKAIEYFLRKKVKKPQFIHFGLTSDDTNNIAYALALTGANKKIVLPAINEIIKKLENLVKQNRDVIMLARTHGQAAVPTTLGKECKVYLERIKKISRPFGFAQGKQLRDWRFEAKLNGAVGNFNAMIAADPKKDWVKFSDNFIKRMGLVPNHFTTQILPYDNWVEYFSKLKLLNNILIGFCRDIWRYISDDYLVLKAKAGEVGSSTMPQKVNPIDYENAEGNLGIANALFEFYERKLPISRLQRDLSDSTVRRTFGVALGHSLLGYQNVVLGLEKVSANKTKMAKELNDHWEVVSEGIQTILKKEGLDNAYEKLKDLVRGKKVNKKIMHKFITDLPISKKVKTKLLALTPENYLGLAVWLAQ